jgi:hypothetical protein
LQANKDSPLSRLNLNLFFAVIRERSIIILDMEKRSDPRSGSAAQLIEVYGIDLQKVKSE